MRRSRLLAVAAVVASYGWVLAGGCSSGGDANNGAVAGSGPAPAMDASSDATKIEPDAMGVGGNSGERLHPLCGDAPVDQQCLPDDAQACAAFRPPMIKPPAGAGGEGGGGEGGSGGVEAGGMSTGGAGLDGEGTGGFGDQAGASGETGGAANAGAAGEGGSAGGDGSEPSNPARYGCQITDVDGVLGRSCQLAGEGAVNAPCFSSSDCQAGLGCVTEGQAGRCLRYCCGGDSTCEKGSYCAVQQLRKASSDTSNAEPLSVPVCVPADDCSLEEIFPCPDSTECRCKGNTACLVVREDGTTTCRAPGTGQQGEACPCAWNHVCSSVTDTCVKICNTDPAKDDCGEQKCQASSELPQNFGVCVGPVK